MATQSEDSAVKASEIDDQPFLKANAQAKRSYGRFNLAIVGGTGVGKSSLVNAVFGRDLAKVGKGLPVTRGVHYFNDDSLGIWDLEGFEIGSRESPAEILRRHLKTISNRPAIEQVSVVWYCVLSQLPRLTSPDIEMIREMDAAGMPVILVLTKVDWTKNPVTGKRTAPQDVEEFRDWLEDPVDEQGVPLDIPIQRVILTSARGKHGKGKGHGLGELVTETLTLSPENEKDAFRIAQRLNLPWKREMARPIIATAASAAAAAAAIPFPVADAAILAPIQLTMMGRIAAIYDLELKTMLSAGALAQLGVQITGQALARSFFKLIPGAGSVVGAGVAFALTAATGEGWLRLSEQVHTGKLDLDKIGESWGQYAPTFLDVIRKMTEQRIAKS
ncbi:GTPase [Marisediminicola antarctica]|uniref:GTPase n=2 Tax=Marisediminicola antarctica TaxID=674079 RepID=A0A7L5AJ26_9MICO|nr:GTPase [Marisediminicola antarctica]